MKWCLLSWFLLLIYVPGIAHSDSRVWSLVAFERQSLPQESLKNIEHMIEGGTPERVHVYVPREQLEFITEWGVNFDVLAPNVKDLRPQSSQKDIGGNYHTPETMRDVLSTMVELYPDLARRAVIGYSVDGRPIDAIVISDRVAEQEMNEPCVRMVGAYHGDEWISFELVIATAWALLGRYEEDRAIQDLVNNHELWLIPMLNPDGVDAFERRNERGVDLNRNFGWAFERTPQSGAHAFSEPETLALYDLSLNRSFHHNLSVHSGAVNFGWVWNHQTELSADEDWFREVGERYLETTTAPGFWITNGAQWYVVNGESTDWLYGIRGGHDYTLEISVEKAPASNLIPEYVEEHIESVLGFYQTPGLVGRVLDAQGFPVEALIETVDYGAPVLSDPVTGVFFRPASEATYTLSVQAPGFEPYQVDVQTQDFTDVVLVKSSNLVVQDYGGLVRGPEMTSQAWIESSGLAEILNAGARLGLYRLGRGDPYVLSHQIDGNRVGFKLHDLNRSQLENRGLWDLVVINADDTILERFATAVCFLDEDEKDTEEFLDLVPLGEAQYRLRGLALEPGTEISFLGPSFERRLPARRIAYEPGSFGVELNMTDWADGKWSVRLIQEGRYIGYSWKLSKTGKELSWVPNQTADWPEEVGPHETGGGCTCQSNGSVEWIMIAWFVWRLLRRQQPLFDKA